MGKSQKKVHVAKIKYKGENISDDVFFSFAPTCIPLEKKTLVFFIHFSHFAKISVLFTLESGK